MNCPNCETDWLKPYKYEHPKRYYKCYSCGMRFSTIEKLESVDRKQEFQATMFDILKRDMSPVVKNKE